MPTMMEISEILLLIIILLIAALVAYTVAIIFNDLINETLEQFNVTRHDEWWEPGGHLYEK